MGGTCETFDPTACKAEADPMRSALTYSVGYYIIRRRRCSLRVPLDDDNSKTGRGMLSFLSFA